MYGLADVGVDGTVTVFEGKVVGSLTPISYKRLNLLVINC